MTNVFIVSFCVDYEASDIRKVFKKKEDAIKFAKTTMNEIYDTNYAIRKKYKNQSHEIEEENNGDVTNIFILFGEKTRSDQHVEIMEFEIE